MIDAIISAIKPIGKHIPHHLVLHSPPHISNMKIQKQKPTHKIDMDFDKHKEAVLLSKVKSQ